MACQTCGSERILQFSGKCNDAFFARIGEHELNDYNPGDIGLGSGDYLRGKLCLDCGQMQGTWPLEQSEMETPPEDEE